MSLLRIEKMNAIKLPNFVQFIVKYEYPYEKKWRPNRGKVL